VLIGLVLFLLQASVFMRNLDFIREEKTHDQ
jgi:hypothetical protein